MVETPLETTPVSKAACKQTAAMLRKGYSAPPPLAFEPAISPTLIQEVIKSGQGRPAYLLRYLDSLRGLKDAMRSFTGLLDTHEAAIPHNHEV